MKKLKDLSAAEMQGISETTAACVKEVKESNAREVREWFTGVTPAVNAAAARVQASVAEAVLTSTDLPRYKQIRRSFIFEFS